MKSSLPTTKQGFTLIELLIAITIVAILSVIGFSIFQNIQRGSRDSVRRIEIDALAKNIEATYDPQLRLYFYTVTQYEDDYHTIFPRDPLTGTPDHRAYCLQTGANVAALDNTPLTTWAANAACPSAVTWTPFNDKTKANNTDNLASTTTACVAPMASQNCTPVNGLNSYQICAKLEATTNVYCKQALQQ